MGGCCSNSYKIESGNEFRNFQKFPKISEKYDNNNNESINFMTEENSELQLFKEKIQNLIDSNLARHISKISLIDIWNISKFYNNNFTSSDFLICDLREKTQKTENFLKKFKYINYSSEHISGLNGDKLNQFRKYLTQKKIIIIAGDEFIKVNKFIDALNLKQITNVNIFILEEPIHNNNFTCKASEIIYSKLDDNYFLDYPYIFLNFRKIELCSLDGLFFIYKIDNEQNISLQTFDNNLLNFQSIINMNHTVNNENILLSFIDDFHIQIFIYVGQFEFTFKFFFDKNFIFIYLSYRNYNDDECVNKLTNLLRFSVYNNASILFVYDAKIVKKSFLSFWISLIFFHVFFTKNNDDNYHTIFYRIFSEKSLEFFSPEFVEDIKKNLNSLTLYANSKLFNISDKKKKLIKNELFLLERRLKNRKYFISIITFLERIFLNIINHPNIEAYYKINRSSKSFRNYIERNENAKKIFIIFGFISDSEEMVYFLPQSVDINNFCVSFDYLNYCVHSIIDSEND